MSDYNPFAKLQSLFDNKTPSPDADKGKGSSPSASGGMQKASRAAQEQRLRKHPARGEPDEDSALFLRTVNALPKTSKTQPASQDDSLFKQAMQAAGIAPMDSKKQKKRSQKAPSERYPGEEQTNANARRERDSQSGHKSQDGLESHNQDPRGERSTTASGTPPQRGNNHPAPRQGAKGNDNKGHVTGQKKGHAERNAAGNHRPFIDQTTPAKACDSAFAGTSHDGSPNGSPSSSFSGSSNHSLSDFLNGSSSGIPRDDFDAHEAELFASAMSDVTPVNKRGRDIHSPAESKAPPRPAGKTPAEIMQEILDGRIEFAIQHTGEYMEGFVQGVSPEVLDKLRLGQYSPEAHIDLHGLNALQAYTELTRFIKNSYQRNIRTVTVITGRGKNSPEGVAVLRNLIQDWLTHDPFKRVVLAFCSAQPRDGGAGALYVLLRKYKKSIGKIQWELPYSGPDADF